MSVLELKVGIEGRVCNLSILLEALEVALLALLCANVATLLSTLLACVKGRMLTSCFGFDCARMEMVWSSRLGKMEWSRRNSLEILP